MKFPRPEFNPDEHHTETTTEFADLIHEYVNKIVKAEWTALSSMVALAMADETKPGIKVTTRYLMDDKSDTYRCEQTMEFDEDVPRGEVRYTTDTSGFGIGPYQP